MLWREFPVNAWSFSPAAFEMQIVPRLSILPNPSYGMESDLVDPNSSSVKSVAIRRGTNHNAFCPADANSKCLGGQSRISGRGAAWLARLTGGQEVAGSNPVVPTAEKAVILDELRLFSFFGRSQIFMEIGRFLLGFCTVLYRDTFRQRSAADQSPAPRSPSEQSATGQKVDPTFARRPLFPAR